MADVFSKRKRSQVMSLIRSTETKPEISIRKLIFSKGFRYRKNLKSLPGKPDIVMPKYKTSIFVHGCFWHGHKNCKYAHIPKSNITYWSKKINGNIERDRIKQNELRRAGWKVITVWECQIKKLLIEDSKPQIKFFGLIKGNRA